MARSAEPDAGAAVVVIGEGNASGASADAPAVATRGTTDNGIETAASVFGLVDAPVVGIADGTGTIAVQRRSRSFDGRRSPAVGERCSDGGHRRHGHRDRARAMWGMAARSLATGRGHDSVRSDDASSPNRGRLTAAALGRQRGARAVHAHAAAAAGDGHAPLDRASGFSDGTAVGRTAARRASVDGAEHRDGAKHRDGRDGEAAAGTLGASRLRRHWRRERERHRHEVPCRDARRASRNEKAGRSPHRLGPASK